MATHGMLQELAHRRWWVARVQGFVRERASDPKHVVVWPDVRHLYTYSPEDAATKYMSEQHIGENA